MAWHQMIAFQNNIHRGNYPVKACITLIKNLMKIQKYSKAEIEKFKEDRDADK